MSNITNQLGHHVTALHWWIKALVVVTLIVGVVLGLSTLQFAVEPPLLVPQLLHMANSQPPVLRRAVALLFGDSLTERSFDSEGGWGAGLAHHFARKVFIPHNQQLPSGTTSLSVAY